MRSHKWRYLLPIFDLLNHSINNNAVHIHENERQCSQYGTNISDHVLKSVIKINSYEQIFINYAIGHNDIQQG